MALLWKRLFTWKVSLQAFGGVTAAMLLSASHMSWMWENAISVSEWSLSLGQLSVFMGIALIIIGVIQQCAQAIQPPPKEELVMHETFQHLVERELRILFDRLGLSERERITLYKHSWKGLFRLGRFSANPIFSKPGRGAYPEGQGCIGSAWEGKEAWDNGAPSPETSFSGYKKYMQDVFGIPRSVSRKFKMRSRSYYAYRIDSPNRDPLAVLVFESTSEHGLDPDQLKEYVKEEEEARLSYYLQHYQDRVPDPTISAEAGF